jgi:hypothetical protein
MKFADQKISVEVNLSTANAIQRMQEIGNRIGQVKDLKLNEGMLVIRSRYGLNRVNVLLTIRANGSSSSTVELVGRGQDMWGVAATRVIEKIVSELEQ